MKIYILQCNINHQSIGAYTSIKGALKAMTQYLMNLTMEEVINDVISDNVRGKIKQGAFVYSGFQIEILTVNKDPIYSCEDEMNCYSSTPILFEPNTLETRSAN